MSWFKNFTNRFNKTDEQTAKEWMEKNPEAVADFIADKERAELGNAISALEQNNERNVEIKAENKIDLDKLNDEIAGK